MSENQSETHQDPAETNQVDTAVETDKQADAPVAPAQEVSPADPAVKSDTVLGKEYEVSPDRGYRVVQPAEPVEDSGDSES